MCCYKYFNTPIIIFFFDISLVSLLSPVNLFMLSRTLVLPIFYQHIVGSYDDVIRKKAEDRFNINELRQFVSIIPMSEAKRICRNRFDAFFHAADAKEVKFDLVKKARVY